VEDSRVADNPPQPGEKCAVHKVAVSIIRTFTACRRLGCHGQTKDFPTTIF
jgi:hypothetical protein